MKIPLLNLIERLRSSQWVLPGLLAMSAVLTTALALQVDQWATTHMPELPWFVFAGSSNDARQLLSTLAGSMVSLTTITFSVTMIVLTLASNQFGPRVLRNFLRDHFNQVVLGSFVAALLYCLLLLGQLPATDTTAPPRIAITLAILFTVICLFALLGFVHHTAKSIQTSDVVKRAAAQLDACIEKLFPTPIGTPPETETAIDEPDFLTDGQVINSSESGYLQAIDLDRILAWAKQANAIVKIHPQPGDFVTAADRLFAVIPATLASEIESSQAAKWFILGHERTGEQDARYGFRQLVEIAVRALSPSTNDPFTAINAIDYIGCALAVVAEREPASRYRLDSAGQLRIVAPAESFRAIATETFTPLRFYSREHPLVIRRFWQLLDTLASRLTRADDQDWLQQTRAELKSIIEQLPDDSERRRLRDLTQSNPS